MPIKDDLTIRRIIQTDYGAARCGFSAAGFAHQAKGFRPAHGKAYVVNSLDNHFVFAVTGAEVLTKVFYFKNIRHDLPSLLQLGIQLIAQEVTQQIDCKHDQHDVQAGEYGDPPQAAEHDLEAIAAQHAQRGFRNGNAQSQKA